MFAELQQGNMEFFMEVHPSFLFLKSVKLQGQRDSFQWFKSGSQQDSHAWLRPYGWK